jgi:hypothetical protein
MQATSTLRSGIGILTAILLAAQSPAQGLGGVIGSQSSGTIRIRVSVMPHVQVNAAGRDREGLDSSSNAPSIRYVLVENPVAVERSPASIETPRMVAGSPAPGAGPVAAPRLVLIVPD